VSAVIAGGWKEAAGGSFLTRSGSVRPVGGVREEFTFPFIFRPERLLFSGRGGDADQMVRIISLCVSLDPVSLFRGIFGAFLLIHEDTFG
jgi:hypothetical protein